MALFPFFINLENVQGYVIGSGEHAQEKIEKLKPYHPKLKLISEDDFRAVCLEEKPFYVIVAGKNSEINHQIANFCRERNILVNVVDDPVYCDFLFPSLITHGNLSIGICTGGASPTAGMLIKKQVEEQLPDRIEEILDFLQEKRPVIYQAFENKKQRFFIYHRLTEICILNNRPMTEDEFEGFIKSY